MRAPFFSIIMPSYLGHYEGTFGKAASDRVMKFHRAIESVMAQTFEEWELIVVSDGCDITWKEKDRYLTSDKHIRFYKVPKQRTWSPHVRNFGLTKTLGLYVCYLDTDDKFGPGHLARMWIALRNAEMPAWGLMNELVWDHVKLEWRERKKNVAPGTSNVVHKPSLCYWPEIRYSTPDFGYGKEDKSFVAALSQIAPAVLIPGGEYYVCHIPNLYDV